MRLCFSLLISLLAAAPPTAAQTLAEEDGWHLGGGVDALRFGHVAVSDGQPGAGARVRPSSRAGLRLGVGRTAGPWDLAAEAGWAEGEIEIGNDVLSVRDLTSDVTRYRLSLAVGHRLATVGTGRLVVELAPTMDLWSVTGDGRPRAGAEGRLVLRLPLGALELENRIGAGLSGSPIEASDIGQVAEERGLWTFLFGVGLRTGL
ncbi:MAG TPA: hypothetical protein VH700_13475 [Gemmatimonadales bacterium]|jgi:hypothetical protein